MQQGLINKRDGFKILGVDFVLLYVLGIFFAFIGWVAENGAKGLLSGYIDSRFHILPFISPYLLISFAFHICLGSPDDIVFFGKRIFGRKNVLTVLLSNILSFVTISLAVFLGELVVGNMWDILFGVELWDYSCWPPNLTQYTSVVTTLGFGGGAYLIFRFVYKPALDFVTKHISHRTALIISLTLGVLIPLDTARMIYSIITEGVAPNFWTINFKELGLWWG